jgi:hypothetical protein
MKITVLQTELHFVSRTLMLEVGVKAYMMYIISRLHEQGHIIRRGKIKKLQ